MGFPIDLPLGKGMTINYMLCIIALSCFFFWLKCGTVVAVGVQASFLQPPAPLKRGYCKKCDRKKTTTGWIVRRPTKRPCKPRGTRGRGFLAAGDCPAELPVINYQVKPDRLNLCEQNLIQYYFHLIENVLFPLDWGIEHFYCLDLIFMSQLSQLWFHF
jgi:hypothetical protein